MLGVHRPEASARFALIRPGQSTKMTGSAQMRWTIKRMTRRTTRMRQSPSLPPQMIPTLSQKDLAPHHPVRPQPHHLLLRLCLSLVKRGISYHQSRRSSHGGRHNPVALLLTQQRAHHPSPAPTYRPLLLRRQGKGRGFLARGTGRRAARMSSRQTTTSWASSCLRSTVQRTSPG
jgi:hypothetical protein